MHFEAKSLMNVPLKELKDKEVEGREALYEIMTRLLYHVDDLEQRLSYLESVMEEQLERGSQSQISSLTNSTAR